MVETYDEAFKRLLHGGRTSSAGWASGETVTISHDAIKGMKTSATERHTLPSQLRERLDPSWRAAAGPSPMNKTSEVEKAAASSALLRQLQGRGQQ